MCVCVTTLALGLWPRQGLTRLQAKTKARESHLMLPKVQKNVKEWTLTLPSELPFWELEFRWTPKFSKGNCRGQNPLDWKVLYIIEKLLKCRCLKLACMTHLDIWNTNYGQKKGWESNWQFDSWSLKVNNWPKFLACRWRETYRWKDLDKGYKFASNLISIGGLHAKLWGPKVIGVSTLGISGPPFGSPRTKCYLDVGLVERHKVYYKGEGGGFPQVQVMMSLVNPNLPVVHPNTKSVETMH